MFVTKLSLSTKTLSKLKWDIIYVQQSITLERCSAAISYVTPHSFFTLRATQSYFMGSFISVMALNWMLGAWPFEVFTLYSLTFNAKVSLIGFEKGAKSGRGIGLSAVTNVQGLWEGNLPQVSVISERAEISASVSLTAQATYTVIQLPAADDPNNSFAIGMYLYTYVGTCFLYVCLDVSMFHRMMD